ncbi:hypothetical protein ABH920_006788 [Catenulispora sp. EB89]|uniref:hypothetical protein n=1 Tax=Catenulispora sp. EB89 TaxID=3156257 RepID=UPI00351269CD
MTADEQTETADDDWSYARPGSLEGMLQRGRGQGAYRAMTDPEAPALIYACLARDHRYMTTIDEREIYLARLVRDLRLPLDPVADCGSDLAAQVLRLLGDADADAVSGESEAEDADEVVKRIQMKRERPYRDTPHDELFALLRAPAAPGTANDAKRPVLFELARRDPDPALLDLAEELVHGDPPRPMSGLPRAVRLLGAAALDHARRWVVDMDHHPLAFIGTSVLSHHGDETDLPVLLARFDQRVRRHDWCGLSVFTDAFARIGLPAAAVGDRRVSWLWRNSPHSSERIDYLKAIVALNPYDSGWFLGDALLDCESQVRLHGVEHAPLTKRNRVLIGRLSTDPLESEELRAAAVARLGSAPPG